MNTSPSITNSYQYGFHKPDASVFKTDRGLTRQTVEAISHYKNEPLWMTDFRLKSLGFFEAKPMPIWGADLSTINFDNIFYYISPTDKKSQSWDDIPQDIRDTYDKIGIPEAEKRFLAGVGAQYDCLTGDTPVWTERGVVPIAKVQVGDTVFAMHEDTKKLTCQKVLSVACKGQRKIFSVNVAGRTIKCTENHPFFTLQYRKEAGKQRGTFTTNWQYLRDLRVGDAIAVTHQAPDLGQPFTLPIIPLDKKYIGKNQHSSFPVNANYLYSRKHNDFAIPAETTPPLLWLIGLYIGDGYITTVDKQTRKEVLSIAIPASDLITRNKLYATLKEVFGYDLETQAENFRVRIASKPIIALFEALKLRGSAKTKTIPEWIFSLPREQKLAFIAGYIDSDGTVRNTSKSSDATITSVNKILLEQVQSLALSSGLHITNIHEFHYTIKQSKHKEQRQATGYRLQITGDLLPLSPYSIKVDSHFIPRKYYHHYASHHGSPIKSHMSEEVGFAPIASITKVGVEEVYDIEVDGWHNFVANGIVVHNSEVVYHNLKAKWEDLGVIFTDTDTALKQYPEVFKQYFGTVIPAADNKFAALNSAVWSGGSFVYVPAGVHVDIPLQAYFRINAANAGQFERTLIIAEEGSYVHYVEGCTAPIYSTDSLHSAVVEIIVKKNARVRYTTIQNWSNNVYNLVTKRAFVDEEGVMEWVDGNIGCLTENAKVYTTNRGIVSIKEVKINDEIFTVDLNCLLPEPQKVTAVLDQGVKPVFKLTTANYRMIEATANHPFLALQKKQFSTTQYLQWQKLSDLRIGDFIAVVDQLPDFGKPYPIDYSYSSKSLKHKPTIPPQTTEDLMWLLGLYLGDGCMDRSANGVPRRIYFATPPTDRARAKLEKLLLQVFAIPFAPKGISVTVNSTILADLFLKLGFQGTAKTKSIPTWVYTLPARQILAFIEGYFDADGYTRTERDSTTISGQIIFASANKILLEHLRLLMIAVGLEPLKISTYVKERKLYKGVVKEYTCHYLSLSGKENLTLIRSKNQTGPRIRFVKVRSIEPIGMAHVYDIEVNKTANFIANGMLVHNSKITMKYPSIFLKGKGAKGEVLSLAFAGKGQHQDAGGKVIHLAPYTTSTITSKSVSVGGGRTSYRGLVKINKGAHGSKSFVRCDALLLDDLSQTDTYPTNDVNEEDVTLGHEATVSKIGDEQLFYLMSRGLDEGQATSLIVNGFIEPIVKELPLEYAVELNRLINLSMEGSVG